jgi:hypothetical protein
MEPNSEQYELYELAIDENLDPDSGWLFQHIGYCGVSYCEFQNPQIPDQSLTHYWTTVISENIVGDPSPDAPLKERLAYFMCTQCPADKYGRRGTWDQVMRWVELRNDYIAIAQCFLAFDSGKDPLKSRLEDPDDSMDNWTYQQLWAYAKAFQILYEVLTEKWEIFSRATTTIKIEAHDCETQKKSFDLKSFEGNLYNLLSTLTAEVSNQEIHAIIQEKFLEYKSKDYGRLVTLKRREISEVRDIKTRKINKLTASERKEIQTLSRKHQTEGFSLFSKIDLMWTILSSKDSWLAQKLTDYKDNFIEIWTRDQEATHKPDLKKHRPSETWIKGHRKSNRRGKYNK